MFNTLLRAFERVVLHTHRSKYTQFLVFFAAQFHSSFPDVFTSRLIDAMLSDSTPVITRLTCAAYLGSFLARATYVEPSTLYVCAFTTTRAAFSCAHLVRYVSIDFPHDASCPFVVRDVPHTHASGNPPSCL